jgi:hypothetical protein
MESHHADRLNSWPEANSGRCATQKPQIPMTSRKAPYVGFLFRFYSDPESLASSSVPFTDQRLQQRGDELLTLLFVRNSSGENLSRRFDDRIEIEDRRLG